MLKPVVLFIIGLICLIKGGDWFVDGASALARKFKLPELLIGATVVSIGTTLPEVMVSTMSALSGHGEIAYGNAIGSVICNTALIAAITIAVKPGKVNRETLRIPVAFFYIAAAIYCVAAYAMGRFTRPMGLIMLGVFLAYMIVNVRSMKAEAKDAQEAVEAVEASKDAAEEAEEAVANAEEAVNEAAEDALYAVEEASDAMEEAEEAEEAAVEALEEVDATVELFEKKEAEPDVPMAKILLLLIAGSALIAVGANLLVDNGTLIAQAFGVPESVIALTFVALGTSLPELVTAITSLAKGHGALSLGNVIGANVFNLVLVSGVSVTLAPFVVPQSAVFMGHNSSLVLEIPVMLLVMSILTIPSLIRGKLTRRQGILLLLIYAVFCAIQFTM